MRTTTRSDDVRSLFEGTGVVQLAGIFDDEEITHIRQTFTSKVESDPSFATHDTGIASGDILNRYPRFVHPHRHPEDASGRIARDLMMDHRLLQHVQNFMGPVYGAQSMFYFKPPTARGQALHQDNLSLQAHPETCLAAWIAVDDCDAENGALIVIPGSHRSELLCLEDADPSESFSSTTVRLPKSVDSRKVQTEMKAGDVLFFHGSLVHGSLPNTSETRFRRSLIFHYVPQTSVEVAKFYHPLVSLESTEVSMGESAEGGPCGDWVEAA